MVSKEGVKAFRELVKDVKNLSDIELNFLILIGDILSTLKSLTPDVERLSSIISEWKPMIDAEIARRLKDTVGTV